MYDPAAQEAPLQEEQARAPDHAEVSMNGRYTAVPLVSMWFLLLLISLPLGIVCARLSTSASYTLHQQMERPAPVSKTSLMKRS
jgi:hypothetical protein